MANRGNPINFSYLSGSWDESNVYINSRGNGNYIDGYWYIGAPSFLVKIWKNKNSNGRIQIFVSYYNYSTGTWSTEENMKLEGGNKAAEMFWSHNAPDSTTAITASKTSTDDYYLWRVRQEMSSAGEEGIDFWAGPIGIAGQSFYTNHLQGKTLNSTGVCSAFSWTDERESSSKYIYVAANWGQDDNGAIQHFAARNNRGTLITPSNARCLCHMEV